MDLKQKIVWCHLLLLLLHSLLTLGSLLTKDGNILLDGIEAVSFLEGHHER